MAVWLAVCVVGKLKMIQCRMKLNICFVFKTNPQWIRFSMFKKIRRKARNKLINIVFFLVISHIPFYRQDYYRRLLDCRHWKTADDSLPFELIVWLGWFVSFLRKTSKKNHEFVDLLQLQIWINSYTILIKLCKKVRWEWEFQNFRILHKQASRA